MGQKTALGTMLKVADSQLAATVDGDLPATGICAFPLSQGRSTGRGLERVIAELLAGLDEIGQPYSFYERGVIRNELLAVLQSAAFMFGLARQRHAVWFAVYPVAALFPLLARKRPVITGVYDLIPFLARGYDNSLKYAIKRACIAFACRRSDHLIVPFESTAAEIAQMFGVPRNRISVIPLGIDHKRFYIDETVQTQPFRVGFLGEAKRAKGLDTTILAFAKILTEHPDAFLTIASGGNELESLKELARTTLPAGSYEFVGFVAEDDMRKFYAELDIFLFPSRYGFGMSAVEAMACGTPAIIGRTLDSQDFFDDELSVVDPESAEELAERVVTLLKDRDLYNHLRDWGLRKAGSLSWQQMASDYAACWMNVADAKKDAAASSPRHSPTS
jgi:glycosyltransferase involved in cell wall biosynthesis